MWLQKTQITFHFLYIPYVQNASFYTYICDNKIQFLPRTIFLKRGACIQWEENVKFRFVVMVSQTSFEILFNFRDFIVVEIVANKINIPALLYRKIYTIRTTRARKQNEKLYTIFFRRFSIFCYAFPSTDFPFQ